MSKSQIERREEIYIEFLNEVNAFVYKAFEPKDLRPTAVTPMMSLESKVLLVSGHKVQVAASKLCSIVFKVHKADEKSKLSSEFQSVRVEFTNACKEELGALHEKI